MGNVESYQYAIDVGLPAAEAFAEDVPVLKLVAKIKQAVEKAQAHLQTKDDIWHKQEEIQQNLDYVAEKIWPTLYSVDDQQLLRSRLQELARQLHSPLQGGSRDAQRRLLELNQANRSFADGLQLVHVGMQMRNQTLIPVIKYDVEILNPEHIVLKGPIAISNFQICAADWHPAGKSFGLKLPVAVKLYPAMKMHRSPEDLLKTVLRHAKLQMDATHPNVLRLYGVCHGNTRPGEIMLVMPLVRLGSLYNILHKKWNNVVDACVKEEYLASEKEREAANGALSEKSVACKILHGTAAGVASMHRRGISHCDLKSSNVVIEAEVQGGPVESITDYTAKVIDFDAALIAKEDQNPEGPSSSLGGISTAAYRAPELWPRLTTDGDLRGIANGTVCTTAEIIKKTTDLRRADVYSMGIIIYEVMTCREPLADIPAHACYDFVCNKRRRPQFDRNAKERDCYDRGLEECYHKCVVHDADERPDMTHVAEVLSTRDTCTAQVFPACESGQQRGRREPQPEPQTGLEDFLDALGLASHAQSLRSEGVERPDHLRSIAADQLVGVFGFSQREAEAIHSGRRDEGVAAPRSFAEELRKHELSVEAFRDHTAETVLTLSKEEIARILPRKMDQIRFMNWRSQALCSRPVKEAGLWLQDIVQRSTSGDWCYKADEDEDETEADGGEGGQGYVLGIHTSTGRMGDAPKHPGFAKVQWVRTGYRRSYRIGVDGKYDLQYTSGPSADLTDVPAGGVRLEHLQCNFGYPMGVHGSHFSLFDTRPEVCRLVAPFVPGDLVTSPDSNRTSTCVGVKYHAKEHRVEMWFHVDGAEGAGLYTDLHNGAYRKVGHRAIREYSREEVEGASDGEIDNDERWYVTRNLRPTMKLRCLSGALCPFDTRHDMIERFGVPYTSGDVLEDKHDGERTICVGVARGLDALPEEIRHAAEACAQGPDLQKPRLFFWSSGARGAGVNAQMHKMLARYKVVGRAALREDENPWEHLPTQSLPVSPSAQSNIPHPSQLQLTFPFPCGERCPTGDRPFDVRPEVIEPLVNMRPGAILSLGSRTFVLIGIARGGAGRPEFWFYEASDAGATIIQHGLIPALGTPTGQLADLNRLRTLLRNGPVAAEQLPLVALSARDKQPSCCVVL